MSPWDAHVTRALLESEGIPAFLAHEHQITANWPMSLALGGVRVLVPTHRLMDAAQVLDTRESGELEAALHESHPVDPVVCRNCGSTRLREERDWVSIALAVVLLFMARITYPPVKVRTCVDCGRQDDGLRAE